MRTDATSRHTSPVCGGDDDSSIHHGQQKVKSCSYEKFNILTGNSRNCGSMWLQGLQKGWRRSAPRKIGQLYFGREGISGCRQSRGVRVSGRVRLRTKSRHRRQDSQLCEGQRRCHQSARFTRRRRVSDDTSIKAKGVEKCIITTSSTVRRILFTLLLLNYVLATKTITVDGFGLIIPTYVRGYVERDICGHTKSRRKGGNISGTQLQNTHEDDNEGEDEDNEVELEVEKNDLDPEIDQKDDFPSPIEDLSWRVEKLRLEEANTRRFLKAGPRFLPYEECRKWVQAWDRWDSEDDWVKWIDEGEKRNSYIPARPDEYYGKIGKWKGWGHFLGKDSRDDFQ